MTDAEAPLSLFPAHDREMREAIRRIEKNDAKIAALFVEIAEGNRLLRRCERLRIIILTLLSVIAGLLVSIVVRLIS